MCFNARICKNMQEYVVNWSKMQGYVVNWMKMQEYIEINWSKKKSML